MNLEQFKSLVAKALGILGGYLAGTSWSSGFILENWELISGVVMSVATLVWSLKVNTQAGLVKATTAVVEDIPVTHEVKAALVKVAAEATVLKKGKKS